MKNHLYDEWLKFHPNGQPPVRHATGELGARVELCKKYAYAVPSPDAILFVASFSPLVEVGAGTGYWAALLRGIDADIVAYELMPPAEGDNPYFKTCESFTEIKTGDIEELKNHPDRTLFLCWPNYDTPFAFNAVKNHGGKLVYIGEGDGGCCGDDSFWELLREEFQLIETRDLPQWYGLHDWIMVYEPNA